jgi:pimeloyl-ACP methyl ester carboxylesterase
MLIPPLLLACALAAPALGTVPADTLVDVGGHRLRVEVIRGDRPLAFVLESGGGAELASWAWVPESIAARTGATVVVYDRAGFGGSELGPADLSPEEQIEDLREALEALEVPRPRILAGHSYGGLMAMLHAARHPDEVVGLLLVDAMNPRFVAATGDFVHSTVPAITDPTTDREHAGARLIRTFDAFVTVVAAEEPAIDLPVAIVTAGEPWWGPPEIDSAWRASHASMAEAAPNRWLVVAEGSDHDIPAERPDAIVDAAVRLLEATIRPD